MLPCCKYSNFVFGNEKYVYICRPLKNHIIWPKNNLRHTEQTYLWLMFSSIPTWVLITFITSNWKNSRLILAKYANSEWQARLWDLRCTFSNTFISPDMSNWTSGGIFFFSQRATNLKLYSNVYSVLLLMRSPSYVFCFYQLTPSSFNILLKHFLLNGLCRLAEQHTLLAF